jgi:hypothetical protein
MKPVGLTMKMGGNKYRLDQRGELMLVHQCMDCGVLSINRVAADDVSSTIYSVFEESLRSEIHRICEEYGILTLGARGSDALRQQLYGNRIALLDAQ